MPLLQRRRCPSCGEPVDGKTAVCPHCGSVLSLKASQKDQVEKDFDDILQAIIQGPKTPGVKRSEELDEELRDLELGGIPPPRPKPKPSSEASGVTPPDKQEPPVTSPEAGALEDLLTFECPSCGAQVPEDATKCPTCGVAFNGSEQFDCPVCGSAVAFEAVQCPKCGVRFVEDRTPGPYLREPAGTGEGTRPAVEEVAAAAPAAVRPPAPRPASPRVEASVTSSPISPSAPEPARWSPVRAEPAEPPVGQRELSALVAEVKAFLAFGKRHSLSFGSASEAILRATELARRKEFQDALTLMGQAREALLRGYQEQARQRLEAYARSSQGTPPLLARIQQAQKTLAQGDLERALALGEQVASQLAARDPRALETRKVMEETAGILEQLKGLGFDGTAVQEVLQRSQSTLARGDIVTARGLALQGRDRALGVLKEGLAEELKRAKDSIFDMKLKGQRLEKPLEIIKRASLHFKQEEWAAAARELLALRQELRLYQTQTR